ncbi:hypothetical protein ACWEVD_10835 [Nocardia thailandica]
MNEFTARDGSQGPDHCRQRGDGEPEAKFLTAAMLQRLCQGRYERNDTGRARPKPSRLGTAGAAINGRTGT